MSTSNKHRRAAKQKQRARKRACSTQPSRSRFAPGPEGDLWDFSFAEPTSSRALAEEMLSHAITRVARQLSHAGPASADEAQAVLRILSDVGTGTIAEALNARLAQLRRHAARGGWSTEDLAELVARRVGEEHAGVLVDWRPPAHLDLEELAPRLHLAALLMVLPLGATGVAPSAPARPAVSQENAKRLATVRGLLAKAERTSFDEEADALSAKAQELISKHALEQLLQHDQATSGSAPVPVRRIWLDPPYLLAKAMMVDVVATANRCRCLVAESVGLCSVIGAPTDLDAVELLATSLLVQANRSMLRHGRYVDQTGTSKTRSFRQSFLVSFATRVGQRLHEVNQDAVDASGSRDSLLPALRQHSERIDDAFTTMFPQTVPTSTPVTNGAGWAAGHVAADLAQLDLLSSISGEDSLAG